VTILVCMISSRFLITEVPLSNCITHHSTSNGNVIPGKVWFSGMIEAVVFEETTASLSHLGIVLDGFSEAIAIFKDLCPLIRSAHESKLTIFPSRDGGAVSSSVRNTVKRFTERNAEKTDHIIGAVKDEKRHLHKLHGIFSKEALPGLVVLAVSSKTILVDRARAILTIEYPSKSVVEEVLAIDVGTVKEDTAIRSSLEVFNRFRHKAHDLISVVVSSHTTSRITDDENISCLVKTSVCEKILNGFNKDTITTVVDFRSKDFDGFIPVARERSTIAVDKEGMVPVIEVGVVHGIFADGTTINKSICPNGMLAGANWAMGASKAFFITHAHATTKKVEDPLGLVGLRTSLEVVNTFRAIKANSTSNISIRKDILVHHCKAAHAAQGQNNKTNTLHRL